jgi:hypothetical protein
MLATTIEFEREEADAAVKISLLGSPSQSISKTQSMVRVIDLKGRPGFFVGVGIAS